MCSLFRQGRVASALFSAVLLAQVSAAAESPAQAPTPPVPDAAILGLAAPKLFAPGPISTPWNETSAAFTPDGQQIYFMRADYLSNDNTIMVSRQKDGVWQKPEVAPFSGQWRDSEPALSHDGYMLYFISNRPAKAGGEPLMAELNGRRFPGANVWRVIRRDNGWSQPEHLEGAINDIPMIYNPSVAADGTLYFSSNRPEANNRGQIYRSRPAEGSFPVVEKLSFSDNRWSHIDPAIDRQQRFVVFASGRPGALEGSMDLFISFQIDGVWQEPEWLGPNINSSALENAPSLAPDGRTLFFASMRQPPLNYPKKPDDAAAVEARLTQPQNGSRNLWSVDIGPLLDARLGGKKAP